MKHKLLCIILTLVTTLSFAQIELQPNPSNINSGTLTFKYGEFGDYSIFDPLGNPNLYLYTGLQTDADPLTWDYNDGEFTLANLGQMIPLNFDGGLGYYVATFNPATRSYIEELTQNLTTIPDGTEVFDWYFLITTNDLSRQSADLRGSDYGFGSDILSVNEIELEDEMVVVKGDIKFYKDGSYLIETYDMLGKQIALDTYVVVGQSTYKLPVSSNGLYIVKVTSGEAVKTLKVLKQ
ncbi:T9SS type A sorting domain-containing protein [Psychroserpens sp.]|uniref:T9SS type A sorting domain-containing protein n=1 Tax=Psychroserpens sp. TaxID=2020870 RepID=UPI001B1F7B2E|nr:T9SS type A sorting domain-containing protein [Psychroserpens sp.]MBO6606185.1 T9SS type A sorting domain-containing protein [Psychroserpens sp.]MBO6652443.1 T9SS type A sorting domain-containing protein [Psychroserpens sp.]MBO6681785.1 T9SS type A sorting domain-containing protein [Psychroserpens sp.]MBO6749560.1 T9SS type A sorting domain-containing protein [Psychroserpens sp.]MBO6913995.1 T9SS type A sorting domain-containing protein [Psychroserpens sp.]